MMFFFLFASCHVHCDAVAQTKLGARLSGGEESYQVYTGIVDGRKSMDPGYVSLRVQVEEWKSPPPRSGNAERHNACDENEDRV